MNYNLLSFQLLHAFNSCAHISTVSFCKRGNAKKEPENIYLQRFNDHKRKKFEISEPNET